MKCSELVKTWLTRKEMTVKPATYANYTCAIFSYILPKFGDVELDAITEDVVQAWIGEMSAAGIARATITNRIIILMSSLQFAEKKGWRKNAGKMDLVYPRRFVSEDDRRELALKPETCAALVKAVDEYLDRPPRRPGTRLGYSVGVLVSLFTGLRIGEVCGLKWEDIDLDGGVIHVRRTVQRSYGYGLDGKGKSARLAGPPKSRTSRRDVPICAPLRERLERLMRIDPPKSGTAYFLTNTEGGSEPRSFRAFVDQVLSRHGIGHFNFHRLRHTFATRCIEAGVDAKTTSELLGHANVNITLNLYVHPNADAKRNAVDRMAAAFEKAGGI